MENFKKYLPDNWHSFFIDGVFIVLSFTFFPLIGWIFVEWFEIWLAGKGNNLRQVLFYSSIIAFFAIICRIIAVHLKRFPVRKRFEDFKSGKSLAWLNIVAIFWTYLIAFVGLIEMIWGDTRSQDFPSLINISVFLVLVGGMLFVEFRLLSNFDKPLGIKKARSINHVDNSIFNSVTEWIADILLFVYILVLQCFYYAYMAETLDYRLEGILDFNSTENYFWQAGFSILVIFFVFLFLYAAPRLIYSKSYDEDTNYWMLGLVFIASVAGFFVPKSIAWLF